MFIKSSGRALRMFMLTAMSRELPFKLRSKDTKPSAGDRPRMELKSPKLLVQVVVLGQQEGWLAESGRGGAEHCFRKCLVPANESTTSLCQRALG